MGLTFLLLRELAAACMATFVFRPTELLTFLTSVARTQPARAVPALPYPLTMV